MAVTDETRIAIRVGQWGDGLGETEITSALFSWFDVSTKNAYGATLALGQVVVQQDVSGWNAASEGGENPGGAVTRYMY